MIFATAGGLAIAGSISAYRTGINRGMDGARTIPVASKGPAGSLEEQASDAGYARAQLQAKLAENGKVIDDLKRQLSEQIRVVNSLKTVAATPTNPPGSGQRAIQEGSGDWTMRDEELVAARAKLVQFQKTLELATAQQGDNARQAAGLEAKVNELTQLLRAREQALDQREAEGSRGQELLEHDRDIRELMGARELYMADVHDVSGREGPRRTGASSIPKESR